MPWRSSWPHVRAALILLHVVAVVLLAVPSLRTGMDRGSWSDPTVQAEFRAWADRLGMSPERLEETAWELAQSWRSFHETITKPLEPYRKYVGVRQPWVMFVAPQRYPARIEIDVLEEQKWRTVYRERSNEHEWHRRLFDNDRMRSAFFRFAWDRYAPYYREFTEWVAREAARDFPEATAVRVRLYRFRTPSPDEVKEDRIPSGKYEKEIVHSLSAFR